MNVVINACIIWMLFCVHAYMLAFVCLIGVLRLTTLISVGYITGWFVQFSVCVLIIIIIINRISRGPIYHTK